MLISKFDLYKSEWLELVFDDRNKDYGAYELRNHYPRTLAAAMAITFLSIASVAFLLSVFIKPVVIHNEVLKSTVVTISPYIQPAIPKPPKPISHVKALTHSGAAAALPASAHLYIPPVLSVDNNAVDPPKISALEHGTIGPVEIKGPDKEGGSGVGPGIDKLGSGVGTPDIEIHSAIGLERMPEPYGGAAAWSKFLKKNLNYPEMAIDQQQHGRVLVSFVIEKDGHLSNFVIERSIGYGMDEEAVRVLKRSPAWMPGLQNGQPVRVKYTIPINFQMNE